jgi:hypothetical protein
LVMSYEDFILCICVNCAPLHFICTKDGRLGCSRLRTTWVRFVPGQWRYVARLCLTLSILRVTLACQVSSISFPIWPPPSERPPKPKPWGGQHDQHDLDVWHPTRKMCHTERVSPYKMCPDRHSVPLEIRKSNSVTTSDTSGILLPPSVHQC